MEVLKQAIIIARQESDRIKCLEEIAEAASDYLNAITSGEPLSVVVGYGKRLERGLLALHSIEENQACTGKVQYGHKETADKAAAAMLKKHGEELESYECGFCDKWHIGHAKTSEVAISIEKD